MGIVRFLFIIIDYSKTIISRFKFITLSLSGLILNIPRFRKRKKKEDLRSNSSTKVSRINVGSDGGPRVDYIIATINLHHSWGEEGREVGGIPRSAFTVNPAAYFETGGASRQTLTTHLVN